MLTRRNFLAASGAAAVGLSFPMAGHALGPEDVEHSQPTQQLCSASGKKPNVILILCDDLGWGDLGNFWQKSRQAGQPHINTPNLDDAMQQGIMLKAAYTTAPVCAPARASMVTGKNQGHCSLRDNMFDRPIDVRMTLGTVMKQAGYSTWHIGKWGIGGGYESGEQPRRSMPCDAGFDYSYGYPAHAHGHSFYHFEHTNWRTSKDGSPIVESVSAEAYAAKQYLDLSVGAEGSADFEPDPEGTYYRRQISNAEVRYCYDTDLFTAKIKQLINEHTGPNPFFCYACYTTVHGSGNINQVDRTLKTSTFFHVPGQAYPKLDEDDATWGGGVKWKKDDNNGYLPFKEGTGPDKDNISNTYIYPDYKDNAKYNTAQQRYATNVQRLDDAIGDLLHFLKIRGLLQNTLFIFTSDNGPAGEYLINISNSYGSGYPGRYNWVQNGFKSNGPFSGMKRWVNEGGMREPTFALWPAAIPASSAPQHPRESNFPFQFPAWMATLADVAGLPQPARCDGISILPTLTGSGRQLPMRIYGEQEDAEGDRGFAQMVRDGDYVLLCNKNDNATGANSQLFNVVQDPAQSTNLATRADQSERLVRMKNLLITCRLPSAKMKAASGAMAFSQSPTALENAAIPATICKNRPSLAWPAKVYRQGADRWPWVPMLRTLVPDDAFTAATVEALQSKIAALSGAYGLSLRGWFYQAADGDLTITSAGTGGIHLWLHEIHALDWEATTDASRSTSITLTLKKGYHPLRIYLTQTSTIAHCTLALNGTPLLT